MIRRIFNFDGILFGVFVVLLCVGLVALYSIFSSTDAGMEFVLRQAVFCLIGVAMAIGIGMMSYDLLRQYSRFIYLVMLTLLVAVLFFGETIRGTVGWISIGSINVQVVEIVKVLMIIFLASLIATKRAVLGEVGTIITSFLVTLVIIFLIMMQPDLGSAAVVLMIWLGMIVVSGIKKRYIATFFIGSIIFLSLAWLFLAPYQKARITNFLHPENDPQNTGYNVIQSMIAVGNGGPLGQGVGYGTQSRLNFLPEKHTDFIFAAFTESMGFIGAVVILVLFGILFVRLRSIAIRSYDAFGYFLIVGLTIMYFVHITINIGMNIGLMPVTGIPLPFISYGGSSILSMSIGVGIALAVYRKRKKITEDHVVESY